MTELLIIQGHSSGEETFNGALARAYAGGAQDAGVTAKTLVLAQLSFDPILRAADQSLEPDLIQAQRHIQSASHVAWFFPTWWVAPPALVKGFVDRVFLPGWAYRYRAESAWPEALLRGRSARLDSPSLWYRFWQGQALHRAFRRGTLRFSGFAPIFSTTIHQARTLDEARRQRWLGRLAELGRRDAGAVKSRCVAQLGGRRCSDARYPA